ncbi:MAG: VWA domain-containing protein [Actinobacteria bacterium]|nr:VWA domain-containing protein [Actinomycetota bacterium]
MTAAAPTTARPSRDVVDVVLGFARTLRHAGVPAGPDRVQAMLAALGHLDVLDPSQVYWAGRLTLCADPEDLDRYDAAFALYFGNRRPAPGRAADQPPPLLRPAAFEPDTGGAGEEEDTEAPGFAVHASRHEVLRHKDVTTLTAAERAQLQRLFALLAPRASGRRSLRHRTARRGRVDLERTVRRMLAHGGEPAELARRRRRTKPRRLVLLVDVSGSMAPYADWLLRFGHAAVRSAPLGTEVFTLGTRLTRVTRELRLRDPDRALAAAGRAVPDWRGGTRLGDTLKAFTDRWGQRGVARGAVLVVCSDGWERGDPAELGSQLARLARLAHAVVWVNPHKGKDGFAPVTGGMVAALPHIDSLVAGHSFAALAELVEVIAGA